MNIPTNLSFVDLDELLRISRGDKRKAYEYLDQFQHLVTSRMRNVRKSLRAGDRHMVRQVLHSMIPQLQFFGVPGVVRPIRQLEYSYKDMPMSELKNLVKNILIILEKALADVDTVLSKNFD